MTSATFAVFSPSSSRSGVVRPIWRDGHGRRLGFKLLRKPLQIDHLEAAVKQALSDRKIEA
jgi:hypothetical protein